MAQIAAELATQGHGVDGDRGGGLALSPHRFFDTANQCCLAAKALHGLSLGQTTDMAAYMLERAAPDRPVPDHSTASRKRRALAVHVASRAGTLDTQVNNRARASPKQHAELDQIYR